MIGTLISIIFTVIILGILWWGAQQLLPLIPMGEPFRTIVRVLMIIVIALVALWIIWQLLIASGVVSGRPFRLEPRRARWNPCRLIRQARRTSAVVASACAILRPWRFWLA